MKLAELVSFFFDRRQRLTLFLETWSRMQTCIVLFSPKFHNGRWFLSVVKKGKDESSEKKQPPPTKQKYFSNVGNPTFHAWVIH